MNAVQNNEVQAQDNSPEQPSLKKKPVENKGFFWGTGYEGKVGFFAGRIIFIIVGTLFLVMVIFSFFMTWVATNEPYLQPFVVNDKLYQDKIYLQVEGENTYREIIIATEPGVYDQKEITQLPSGAKFKIIFTPKNLEIPESYFVNFAEGPLKNKEIEAGYIRQARYLRDEKFYSITITPQNGNWPDGRYVIDAPSGGMFGGRYYAYFTIGEVGKS